MAVEPLSAHAGPEITVRLRFTERPLGLKLGDLSTQLDDLISLLAILRLGSVEEMPHVADAPRRPRSFFQRNLGRRSAAEIDVWTALRNGETSTKAMGVRYVSYQSPLEILLVISAGSAAAMRFGRKLMIFAQNWSDTRTHITKNREVRTKSQAAALQHEAEVIVRRMVVEHLETLESANEVRSVKLVRDYEERAKRALSQIETLSVELTDS